MMNAAQSVDELAGRRCEACARGTQPLSPQEVEAMLGALAGWQHREGQIEKTFQFQNFHETMAFVNAVAWISHREDHHPDLAVGYSKCRVEYSTHKIGGLSDNDFICAAKVEKLLT